MLARIMSATASPWSMAARSIGVSMLPGQTALMRMPVRAFSRAAVLVRPSTPCLVAQ